MGQHEIDRDSGRDGDNQQAFVNPVSKTFEYLAYYLRFDRQNKDVRVGAHTTFQFRYGNDPALFPESLNLGRIRVESGYIGAGSLSGSDYSSN
jgi:hypothetical protein